MNQRAYNAGNAVRNSVVTASKTSGSAVKRAFVATTDAVASFFRGVAAKPAVAVGRKTRR